MKMLKIAAMVITLSALSGAAQAAFLIEPHLGYNITSSGDSTEAGVKTEYDYSGAQYGLRAGGQYLGFMAGLDYTLSNPEIETKVGGFTFEDDFNKKELGVFVGYNLPILLRVWAGYYFDVTAKDDDSRGAFSTGDELSGSAIELGVGFTALPFLSLNVMYRNVTFDEFKSGGVTVKLSGDAEVSTHEIVVGVSLPLTL